MSNDILKSQAIVLNIICSKSLSPATCAPGQNNCQVDLFNCAKTLFSKEEENSPVKVFSGISNLSYRDMCIKLALSVSIVIGRIQVVIGKGEFPDVIDYENGGIISKGLGFVIKGADIFGNSFQQSFSATVKDDGNENSKTALYEKRLKLCSDSYLTVTNIPLETEFSIYLFPAQVIDKTK